jgi:cytochrome c553
MKRAILIGTAVLVTGIITTAAAFGPELLAGYRFMNNLDRYYVNYEANGGSWPQIQDSCANCHGANGQSKNGQFAALSGQPVSYLRGQLHAFAEGRRPSAQMAPLASNLSDEQIQTLAEYFSRQPVRITEAPEPDAALAKRGEAAVAANGCVACHGEKLSGSPLAPRIAGQGERYLLDQLHAFRQGQRKDPNQAMNAIATLLSDDDVRATAHYLSSLSPGRPSGAQ